MLILTSIHLVLLNLYIRFFLLFRRVCVTVLLYVCVIHLLFIDSLHYFTCHTGAIDIRELKATYLLTYLLTY